MLGKLTNHNTGILSDPPLHTVRAENEKEKKRKKKKKKEKEKKTLRFVELPAQFSGSLGLDHWYHNISRAPPDSTLPPSAPPFIPSAFKTVRYSAAYQYPTTPRTLQPRQAAPPIHTQFPKPSPPTDGHARIHT